MGGSTPSNDLPYPLKTRVDLMRRIMGGGTPSKDSLQPLWTSVDLMW